MSAQGAKPVAAKGECRLDRQPGEVINRRQALAFTWNGKEHTGFEGDTIASALAASGVRVLSRSFKYHRPRGLLTASHHDPGATVQVGDEPNVRAAHRLLSADFQVSSQNTWPSLRFDVKSANQAVGRFLAPGFYYKTFIRPQRLWPAYQKVLARFAHAGTISSETPEDYYDKRYAHPDVLVAGGGPAGMAAAIAAAESGQSVMLVEEEHALGGHLRYGSPADLAVRTELMAAIAETPNIEVLTDSVVVGRYDDNWVAVLQRSRPGVRERLIKARAKVLVAAPGLIERPYVFAGNDLPGVLLSTAVRRLINLYAVRPGERAVVLTANAAGDAAAEDLRRAGIEVTEIVDARYGQTIRAAKGRGGVTSVELADGRTIEADLLVTAVGWTANTALLNMAGNEPTYRPSAARFLPDPDTMPDDVLATGGVVGDGTLDQLREHASAVGTEAARRAAARRARLVAAVRTVPTVAISRGSASPATEIAQVRIPDLPLEEHPELFRAATHGFVDYSEDVSSKDLISAVREGYDSAELVKRYTTVTMGPSQGKLELVNAVAVLAEATGSTIAETGTTTFRPMYAPITLGALAGRIFEPVRHSPMQPWHDAHGAHPLIAGQWIRPEHYGDPVAEVRSVREAVGIIDVTPIGKLDLRGPDVAKLLNQLYINKWSKLGVGKVRYGVMCAEDGVVMDDGVTGRLAEDHYLMSTTSSGAATVWEWVENWLQTEHPDWQVHVTPVTTAYASINVAGPRSRELLGRLVNGVDLSAEAFPYMNVRTGTVAGVEGCVLWRIGFTGELSYEVHVPAGHGLHVWEALVEHGRDLRLRPFGVEAQRILRLEKGHFIVGQDTDGLTRAYSAGLDWAVKLDKDDFAGKPELAWQHESGNGPRLVALQPVDPTVVPAEASQIIGPTADGGVEILGRITSSRMSPTLGRSICLGQVEARLAEAGTEVTVRLPDGSDIRALVREHHAHLDPDGARQQLITDAGDPLPAATDPPDPARSPFRLDRPAGTPGPDRNPQLGTGPALWLHDESALGKIGVRGPAAGPLADALATGFGAAVRNRDGDLVVGSGPGEWLILCAPERTASATAELASLVGGGAGFASSVELTHGRALMRLSGKHSRDLLAKVCAIDLSDDLTPNGSALRTSIAKLVTDLVRDDQPLPSGEEPELSYLLHCERSSGRYLYDALADAGAEFGIETD